MIAARPGKAAAVSKEVRRLGGRVRVEDAEIGYVRGRVPIGRIEELVAFEAVQTIDVNVDADCDSSLPAAGPSQDGGAGPDGGLLRCL